MLLLCDDSADAEFCAADLLGQAEHGYNSPAVFVTTSERLAQETLARVQAELEIIPTKETAGVAWADYGEVIVVDNDEEMLAVAEEVASAVMDASRPPVGVDFEDLPLGGRPTPLAGGQPQPWYPPGGGRPLGPLAPSAVQQPPPPLPR